MNNFDKPSPTYCASFINVLRTPPIQGMTTRGQPMLNALIDSGASISIELGRVTIFNQEGFQITKFAKDLNHGLTKEILELLQIDAFSYISYSVGNFKKNPGLTLQFLSEISGESIYTIFNVQLTRQRTTKSGKKGDALPAGNFRVGERSLFFSFWQATHLALPPRLSSFHDYLGNLRKIIFTAEEVPNRPGRLCKRSLRPLSVPAAAIHERLLADKRPTTGGHMPDNKQTSMPDNSRAESLQGQAFDGGSATGAAGYGKTVIRVRGYEGACASCQHRRPQEQTDDEWLADFCNQPNAGT